MLVLLVFLISRLINRSGLRISHSKVFSSERRKLISIIYLEQSFPEFNSRWRVTVSVQQMIDVILSSMPELYILQSLT